MGLVPISEPIRGDSQLQSLDAGLSDDAPSNVPGGREERAASAGTLNPKQAVLSADLPLNPTLEARSSLSTTSLSSAPSLLGTGLMYASPPASLASFSNGRRIFSDLGDVVGEGSTAPPSSSDSEAPSDLAKIISRHLRKPPDPYDYYADIARTNQFLYKK